MNESVLKVGIMPKAEYVKRTLAIARGEYRPANDEPQVWFESIKSLAEVMSDQNRELLALIDAHQPQSLNELGQLSGRKVSNLSRTLKTLESHGLVALHREHGRLVPNVRATRFQVDFGLRDWRKAS